MALYRAANMIFTVTESRKRIALLTVLTFIAMC